MDSKKRIWFSSNNGKQTYTDTDTDIDFGSIHFFQFFDLFLSLDFFSSDCCYIFFLIFNLRKKFLDFSLIFLISLESLLTIRITHFHFSFLNDQFDHFVFVSNFIHCEKTTEWKVFLFDLIFLSIKFLFSFSFSVLGVKLNIEKRSTSFSSFDRISKLPEWFLFVSLFYHRMFDCA